MADGLEPSWSYGASAQEDELDRFKYIYSKFGKYVLSFVLSEPFAVADGVDDGDEDEEKSDFAVDSADWGVTVNQPLWYGGESCQNCDCNKYCEGFGGSGGLQEGDWLVVDGHRKVSTGMKVKIKEL